MQNLAIEATQYTPEINMDPDTGVISITGKSYPENTFEFYQPVVLWLDEYFKNPKETTVLNMEIIYFNSSSSKFFFDLFDLLEENIKNTKIKINWIYDVENESAKEAGEDFIEDFEDLDIELKEK